MKPVPMLTVLAFAVSFAALDQAQAKGAMHSGNVEQTLMRMEQNFVDALVKGDAAGLEHALADTFTFTAPDGSTQTKAEWIADVRNGALKMVSSQNDDMKVRQYGDAAVVTYRSTDHGTYKDKDISGQYRWTDVFVKHNGQWQVVSTQGTSIPPASMSGK